MAYFDGMACLIVNCLYCNKFVNKTIRGRKKTCSEECEVLHKRNLWNQQYANKMANDPDYAKKQSAKQYARIKADPEKMEAKRIAQNERMQLPNYKESSRKSLKKYRSRPEVKEKIAQDMREYRYKNVDIIAKIEAKRSKKRSIERERLKHENPEKYAEILEKEKLQDHARKTEKRLAQLQIDINTMVNKDE